MTATLCDVEIRDGELRYRGAAQDRFAAEVRVTATPERFECSRLAPGGAPLYYRLGRGRIELAADLDALRGDEAPAQPDPGALLALIHGLPDAPGRTPLPGVHELMLGNLLRADREGVRVLRRPPAAVSAGAGLAAAVGSVLRERPGAFALAYSGGLASAFLAVSARAAGVHAPLVHADFGDGSQPLPEIPGARVQRVACDLTELLDPAQLTGAEPGPPLPEVALRRGMLARLQAAAGTPVVTGALLEGLLSTTLPQVATGLRGRRLLACEPFHREGTLPTLATARSVLADHAAARRGGRMVRDPTAEHVAALESQPVGEAPDDAAAGSGLPGLTETGREALKAARLAGGAVWRTHLEDLPPALGRVEAARQETGRVDDHGVGVPALDPRVLAAIGALAPRALGRIRGGRFVNQAPMRDVVARAGVGPVREASPAFRIRLAAASYVLRERRAIAAQLSRECALADLGLLDPAPVLRLLRDGQAAADRALLLLRLVWIDRWLRLR